MRIPLITIAIITCISLSAQTLIVPINASMEISDGASVEVIGDLENNATSFQQQFQLDVGASLSVTGDMFNNGTFHNLGLFTLNGNLENQSNFENMGTLVLGGNWTINNIFNGMDGILEFAGTLNQTITVPSIWTRSLVVNSSGIVQYTGDDFIVGKDPLDATPGVGEITFSNGVLVSNVTNQFLLLPNVRVNGGSIDSYFQGRLSYQGGGDMKFPVGYQGEYGPLTLNEVFGNDVEYTVFYQNPNPDVPMPGADLLGVSNLGLWEVELSNGTITQESPYTIEFSNENLQNFMNENEIRRRFDSPVIAYTPTPQDLYTSLGVESLTNTDSVTFGLITSEMGIIPTLNSPFYLALGRAPSIDPDGQYYVPEIFSPSATDDRNKSFRIFGELITEENFLLEIYNRFGYLVYSTDSFLEANEVGWNGVNQISKAEEPTGTYYYYLTLEKENGEQYRNKGILFLLR